MIICCISFHPSRCIRNQIWSCNKHGQGQLSVIIWTNLVLLEYPTLYTKVQGHRPLGSEETYFQKFLPYMGLEAILVMWRGTLVQIVIPTSYEGSIWNLASSGLVFCVFEEKKFDNVESECIDLGLSQITVYSFILLYVHVPTFISHASIVSWKSTA